MVANTLSANFLRSHTVTYAYGPVQPTFEIGELACPWYCVADDPQETIRPSSALRQSMHSRM